MDHNSAHEDLELAEICQWPGGIRYFLPRIMDTTVAVNLVQRGTIYLDRNAAPRPMRYVDLTERGLVSLSIDPAERTSLAALKPSSMQVDSLRILFIDQGRRYSDNSAHVIINVAWSQWLSILDTCMLLPPALELLYDNNGGSFQHVSYCNDNPEAPCIPAFSKPQPCAYHICFKLCVWLFEHFVYARYDFHTRTTFVVVAGASNEEQLGKVVSQFKHEHQHVDLFDILLALARFWAKEVEDMRWLADHATQRYESHTGFSALNHHGKMPMPPERLRLRADMAATRETLRMIARASDHVGELFQFLQDSLWRYHDVCAEHPGTQAPKIYYQQLSDAFEMRISQQRSQGLQIGDLMGRITAQWDAINAILSHYNNNLTVDMARDSRIDSVLMRRIAFVTMFFLPATFLATFFSMAFFEIKDDGESFNVSRWIWVYFVCTLPLTAFLSCQHLPLKDLFRRLAWFRGEREESVK